jgi:hypothetical protein
MNAFNTPCLVNGKPHSGNLPLGVKFVGMEVEPNKEPRYGKLLHEWFNKPCYETEGGGE